MTDTDRQLAMSAKQSEVHLRHIHDDLNRIHHVLQRIAVSLEMIVTEGLKGTDDE